MPETPLKAPDANASNKTKMAYKIIKHHLDDKNVTEKEKNKLFKLYKKNNDDYIKLLKQSSISAEEQQRIRREIENNEETNNDNSKKTPSPSANRWANMEKGYAENSNSSTSTPPSSASKAAAGIKQFSDDEWLTLKNKIREANNEAWPMTSIGDDMINCGGGTVDRSVTITRAPETGEVSVASSTTPSDNATIDYMSKVILAAAAIKNKALTVELTGGSPKELEKLIALLKGNPNLTIEISPMLRERLNNRSDGTGKEFLQSFDGHNAGKPTAPPPDDELGANTRKKSTDEKPAADAPQPQPASQPSAEKPKTDAANDMPSATTPKTELPSMPPVNPSVRVQKNSQPSMTPMFNAANDGPQGFTTEMPPVMTEEVKQQQLKDIKDVLDDVKSVKERIGDDDIDKNDTLKTIGKALKQMNIQTLEGKPLSPEQQTNLENYSEQITKFTAPPSKPTA